MEFFNLDPPHRAVATQEVDKKIDVSKLNHEQQAVVDLSDIIHASTALDLVMLVDSTPGMAPFLQKAKEFVIILTEQIKTWHPDITFRVAWVCYYEIGSVRLAPAATTRASKFIAKGLEQQRTHEKSKYAVDYCNFTSNIGELIEFLESVHIGQAAVPNANRGCTDILGGLSAVNELLDWEGTKDGSSRRHLGSGGIASILDIGSSGDTTGFSRGTRILFHLGDSPCHGEEFHTSNIRDKFPDGDPSGKDLCEILAALVLDKQVHYVFGKINYTTDLMIKRFNEIITRQQQEKEVQHGKGKGNQGRQQQQQQQQQQQSVRGGVGVGEGQTGAQIQGRRPVSAVSSRTGTTGFANDWLSAPGTIVTLNTDGSPFKVGLLLYQFVERVMRVVLSQTWSTMVLLGSGNSNSNNSNALASYMVKRCEYHRQQLQNLESVAINFSYAPVWENIMSTRVALFPCYVPASVAEILSPGTSSIDNESSHVGIGNNSRSSSSGRTSSSLSASDAHCLAYYPHSPPSSYFGKIKTNNTAKTLKMVPFYARGSTCRLSKVMAKHSYGATTAPTGGLPSISIVSADESNAGSSTGSITIDHSSDSRRKDGNSHAADDDSAIGGAGGAAGALRYKETPAVATPTVGSSLVGLGSSIFSSFTSLLTGTSPVGSATMSTYKPVIHREIIVQLSNPSVASSSSSSSLSSGPSLLEQYTTRLACQSTARYLAVEFNKTVSRMRHELQEEEQRQRGQTQAQTGNTRSPAAVTAIISSVQSYPTIEFAEACLVRLPLSMTETTGDGGVHSIGDSLDSTLLSGGASREEFDAIAAAENDDGDPSSDSVSTDPSRYRIQEDFLQVSARVRSKLAEPITSVAFERYNNNSGYVSPFPSTSNPSVYSTGHTSRHEVVQAFCHWTHVITGSALMVVNCKGVFNKDRNCFLLTAPTIHTVGVTRYAYNGCGCNHGEVGFGRFFATHVCNDICRLLNIEYNIPRYSTGLPGVQYSATSNSAVGEKEKMTASNNDNVTKVGIIGAAATPLSDSLEDFESDDHYRQGPSHDDDHSFQTIVNSTSAQGISIKNTSFGMRQAPPQSDRRSRYAHQDYSDSDSDSYSRNVGDFSDDDDTGGAHVRTTSVGGRPRKPLSYPADTMTNMSTAQMPTVIPAATSGSGSNAGPARVSLFGSTTAAQHQAAALKVDRRPQKPQRIAMDTADSVADRVVPFENDDDDEEVML